MVLIKKRIVWIDTLKGFAAVCVVLGHVADGYMKAHMFPAEAIVLRDLFNGVYLFHMPLFFVLSGMTYRIAYFRNDSEGGTELKSPDRFMSQIVSLALVYVIYCVLMGLMKMTAPRFVNSPVSLTDILLIWAKPVYPYWYLYVLIVFYLFFKLEPIRNWRHDRRILLAVLAVISLLSGFCDTNDWFQIMHIMRYALFFYIGIRLAEGKNLTFGWVVLCAAVSVTVIILYWNNDRFITRIPVVNTVAAIGIVLMVTFAFSRFRLFDRHGLLAVLGEHSMEIFVLHCFFTAGNRFFLTKAGIQNIWLSITANVIISITIPVLISEAARKLKLYDYLFAPGKLFYKCREEPQ